ncbi:hypothetical protein JIQ42_08058 [Leishmania sp. Namibia]|uniref:hypothetical protein n=1 Tax=Leishmania sp. Namibia TaxID=2802991 RepID=UPI001B6FC6F3|nr:hypothetical protein JIQ42_08058 [Leishmania sp. Namibia]
MASPRSSSAPQVAGGGGAPTMLSTGARGNPSSGIGMPLPPGAHFMKASPPHRSGGGAAALMGRPVAAAPPGFRAMVPPGHMLTTVGNRKVIIPPPSLPVSGGGRPLATSPPLIRFPSPGTMALQPGPLGRGPAGSPPQRPQFAFVHGKKIMVPPGMKLPMGNLGPNPATGATAVRAPRQTAMDGMVRMMPPEQSWAVSQRSSLTASPPPGAATGRGAAAAAGGVGGSPSPLHRNLGESPVRPPRQAAALPSPQPQPHPTTAAVAGTTDKKRRKSSLVRGLTGALSFLKSSSLWEEKEEKQHLLNAAALQQQPQRTQTPPEPASRGKGVGSGPAGPDIHAPMPSSRSPPSPSGQAPQRKHQSAHPSQSMSGGSASAAATAMRLPPGQSMAIKGPPGGGGVVKETRKVMMGHPPPDAVHSRASSLERPPLGASRSNSAAAVSLPGARFASPPPQLLQRPYPAGPRLVKRIVGPPPPHAQLIPAPSQQQSRSGSASPPLLLAPPPAVAAAANLLRVPSSTVLKEEQLPEAGVRSPRRRRPQFGESSDESDGAGKDDGAHASAQGAAPSHIDIAGHLRDSSSAEGAPGATGLDTAQRSHTTQNDAALQAIDSARPPEPRDHSDDRGGGDHNDDTRHSTDAMTSGPPASDAPAAVATILRPVRQTVTTAVRSATAAAKRRQEEEKCCLLEAAYKDSLEPKKVRGGRSKSAPHATHASRPQSTSAAREPPSPREEDNTQKPSSVKRSSCSVASTLSRRTLLTLSSSSTSLSEEAKRIRSRTRGRSDAGDGSLPASPRPDPTRPWKHKGKVSHIGSPDARRSEQPARQLRRSRSRYRSRKRTARRSTSKRSSDDGSSDGSDADDEEDAETGFEELTSRDLYRLAKILRDSNAGIMRAGIGGRQRRASHRRSYDSADDGSDRAADAYRGDDGSWGRQRHQHNKGKRRSTPPSTTFGIPWRYVGARRSVGPFASPPPVRRPLGYIDVGGGRYARVGDSPYARHRSRPRAMSIGAVPLDATDRRTWVSNAEGSRSYSPLPVWQSPGPSALVDARQSAVVAEVHTSAVMDSQQASSARGGGNGATAVYYSGHQRQIAGCHGSLRPSRTLGGGSAAGGGSDDTMSSAVDSQHPYCVPASALVPVTQSMSPLSGSTAAAYAPCEQQRGRSSPIPGALRWAPVQPHSFSQQPPPPAAAAASDAGKAVLPASLRQKHFFHELHGLLPSTSLFPAAVGTVEAAVERGNVISDNKSTSAAGDGEGETKSAAAPVLSALVPTVMSSASSTRQAQGYTRRSYSCSEANNSRRAGSKAAADAAATARAGSQTFYAKSNADWSPSRKEAVYLSKATIARLSNPPRRRGNLGVGAATVISPVSRRSHGGGDGNSSVTAQTCCKWLDEILASATVTATGVRTSGKAGAGSREHAAAAMNVIPVVDLRHEFKPRIVDDSADGHGGHGSMRPASPSLLDETAKDYTQEFTGSRARPHIPGISFKYMIGARSATSSPPPRTGGTASATGGGAVNVKTVNGVSEGLPLTAYSSIRIHDPMRKSPWALAPEREGLDVLPGRPALSRRRHIPADESAAAEIGATDPLHGGHHAEDSDGTDGVPHRAHGATRTIVEEVHLDEHRRPYLVVRPVLSSEEGKAQRAAMERLSRPKPVYRRVDDPV